VVLGIGIWVNVVEAVVLCCGIRHRYVGKCCGSSGTLLWHEE
jgi:hypothetical protein